LKQGTVSTEALMAAGVWLAAVQAGRPEGWNGLGKGKNSGRR